MYRSQTYLSTLARSAELFSGSGGERRSWIPRTDFPRGCAVGHVKGVLIHSQPFSLFLPRYLFATFFPIALRFRRAYRDWGRLAVLVWPEASPNRPKEVCWHYVRLLSWGFRARSRSGDARYFEEGSMFFVSDGKPWAMCVEIVAHVKGPSGGKNIRVLSSNGVCRKTAVLKKETQIWDLFTYCCLALYKKKHYSETPLGFLHQRV